VDAVRALPSGSWIPQDEHSRLCLLAVVVATGAVHMFLLPLSWNAYCHHFELDLSKCLFRLRRSWFRMWSHDRRHLRIRRPCDQEEQLS